MRYKGVVERNRNMEVFVGVGMYLELHSTYVQIIINKIRASVQFVQCCVCNVYHAESISGLDFCKNVFSIQAQA